MRKVMIGAAAMIGIAASLALATSNVQADPYRWCAVLSMGDAAYNCGFVTLEQCRATASGITGWCELNPFYTGPAREPARTPRLRRPN